MDKHTATEMAYKNGYAKGVKEFAERMKKAAFMPLGTWFAEKVVPISGIDYIAKEMVGDDNA